MILLKFIPDFRGQFHLITILANTFSMLTSFKDRFAVMNISYDYLQVGGKLVLYIVPGILGDMKCEMFFKKEGKEYKVIISWSENLGTRRRHYSIHIEVDGKIENNEFDTQIFDYDEIKIELERTKFHVVLEFGDLEGNPYVEGHSRFLGFILEK